MQLHDDKFKLTSHLQIPHFQLLIVVYEEVSYSVVPSRQYVTFVEGFLWSLHMHETHQLQHGTLVYSREPVSSSP